MKVNEIMSKKVVQVASVTTVPDVAETMNRENVGVIPIADDGRLVGIVTDRDIAVRAVAKRSVDRPVKEVMTTKPITISPDASVEFAIETMLENKVRRLVVVDQGRVVGMLSLEDLLEGRVQNELIKALEHFHKQTRHK